MFDFGKTLIYFVTVICVFSMVCQAQDPTKPTGSATHTPVQVKGIGLEPNSWNETKLAGLARHKIKVSGKEGGDSVFEGVLVVDLLKGSGLTFGQNLRGERMADYLIAEAADGYRVVFALAELDAQFSDRVVLLADYCDGKPLDERDGPFRIIVSDEKRHARWVRNVVALKIESAPKAK